MTKPDYRALCARMADELDEYRQLLLDDRSVTHRLADEARAAIAADRAKRQPEPKGPTRRQLLQLAAEFWPEGCEPAQAVPFARAVLARWGRPVIEESSAVQPADGEVAELVALIRQIALAWEPEATLLGNMTAGQLARAADLLESLSPPQPVPVSERLPGDELCWWFEADEDCGYGSNWTLLRIRGSAIGYTHWLPAHAMPVPADD